MGWNGLEGDIKRDLSDRSFILLLIFLDCDFLYHFYLPRAACKKRALHCVVFGVVLLIYLFIFIAPDVVLVFADHFSS